MKSIVTCAKSKKVTTNFELLKVSKMTSLNISTYIQSQEAKNIKFGQQVNLIQRVLLGTLTQEVLMSSSHINVSKLIRAKTIFLLTFFFKILFFSDTKTSLKSSHWNCSIKKAVSTTSGICTRKCVESLLNKVAGFQGWCQTYFLYSHLRFYFLLGKTLKNFINFFHWSFLAHF